MDLGRIKDYKENIEGLSLSEIAEIDSAFRALVDSGVELNDLEENALVSDQLDELEAHASTIEKKIYEWLIENFGESEANDPSWSTSQLAAELNKIQVIFGADNGTIGALLGE